MLRVDASNAMIMTQSNEAYGTTHITGVTGVANINMDSVLYEEIDQADKIGTSANCAYGTNSDGVVVFPNSAYGVHITDIEDTYYYCN